MMDTKKEIPMPVVVGVGVIALLLVVGLGFWFLNRPDGPSAADSQSYIQDNLKNRQQGPSQGNTDPRSRMMNQMQGGGGSMQR